MSFLNGTDPSLRQTRTPTTQEFTGSGQGSVTLSADPGSEDNVIITFDGVVQHRSTYSVSGTTLSFSSAVPSGVAKIEATFTTTHPVTEPADNSVTLAKLADGTQGDVRYYGASGAPTLLTAGTSGHFLKTLGSGANPAWAATSSSGGLTSVQVFTSTGTYTKPAGINLIRVELCGSGGGGAGGVNSTRLGGAGAAGGYSSELIDVSSLSSTVAVTIGAGGAGGGEETDGSAGASSSFGSYLSATGGAAGDYDIGVTSLGGAGSGGHINLTGGGGGGQGGYYTQYQAGHMGGASFFGGGGPSSNNTTQSQRNAVAPGSGGGGGGSQTSDAECTAGAGAAGICIIWEYS